MYRNLFIIKNWRIREKWINAKERIFATYVAYGIGLIGKSVSDISQILINSKEKNLKFLNIKINSHTYFIFLNNFIILALFSKT